MADYFEKDGLFLGGEPSDEELLALEMENNGDELDFNIEEILKTIKNESGSLVNNEPVAYCKAQELLEGGAKTHGEGIKESDKEIRVGKIKYIPTNNFKGI